MRGICEFGLITTTCPRSKKIEGYNSHLVLKLCPPALPGDFGVLIWIWCCLLGSGLSAPDLINYKYYYSLHNDTDGNALINILNVLNV